MLTCVPAAVKFLLEIIAKRLRNLENGGIIKTLDNTFVIESGGLPLS